MPPRRNRKKNQKKPQQKGVISPDGILNKAQNLIDTFEVDKAIELLKNGINLYNKECSLYDLLGEAYFSAGDSENSKKTFEKSISIDPEGSFSKYMHMGQLNNAKESVQYFQKGIALMKSQIEQYKSQATPENQQQVIEEINHLNKLICDGFCSIAEAYLTDLCYEDDAEQQCERAVEEGIRHDETRSNVTIYQTLASLKMSQNKQVDAKAAMSKVFEILNNLSDEDKPEYVFLMNTSKIAMELEMFPESEALLNSLIEQYDQVADAWYLLGVNLENQNIPVYALESFERALVVGKSTQEDEKFMKEIEADLNRCKQIVMNNPELKAKFEEIHKPVPASNENNNDDDDDWEDIESGDDDESMDDN